VPLHDVDALRAGELAFQPATTRWCWRPRRSPRSCSRSSERHTRSPQIGHRCCWERTPPLSSVLGHGCSHVSAAELSTRTRETRTPTGVYPVPS
jgi:hypothetical protein